MGATDRPDPEQMRILVRLDGAAKLAVAQRLREDALALEEAWLRAQHPEDDDPFIEEIARRVELGRRAEATALYQGALLGLYRVSHADGEFLDGNAPDALEDASALAVEKWKKGAAAAPGWAAMRDFVSEQLPEWRRFLTRALGRAPANAGKQRKLER